MPSTATITAFYSFTANTRARASQVQANFDNFRGHIVPIEPLTITSADITYDLGSDEHRWRTGYFKSVDFDRQTSTVSAAIQADTATTTAEMLFNINGSEAFRIASVGPLFTRPFNAAGTATAINGFASHAIINVAAASTSSYMIPGSTITVMSSGRKPMLLGFRGVNGGAPNLTVIAQTGTNSAVCSITIYRDDTSTVAALLSYTLGLYGSGAPASAAFVQPLPAIAAWDFSATAGQHTYFLRLSQLSGIAGTAEMDAFALVAFEP